MLFVAITLFSEITQTFLPFSPRSDLLSRHSFCCNLNRKSTLELAFHISQSLAIILIDFQKALLNFSFVSNK